MTVTLIGVDCLDAPILESISRAMSQITYKQCESLADVLIKIKESDYLFKLSEVDIENDEIIFYYAST